jgi:hypothetical protein
MHTDSTSNCHSACHKSSWTTFVVCGCRMYLSCACSLTVWDETCSLVTSSVFVNYADLHNTLNSSLLCMCYDRESAVARLQMAQWSCDGQRDLVSLWDLVYKVAELTAMVTRWYISACTRQLHEVCARVVCYAVSNGNPLAMLWAAYRSHLQGSRIPRSRKPARKYTVYPQQGW